MVAKKRSEAGSYAKRKERKEKMLAHWFKPETIKHISTLAHRWGMGFERDVIAKAIELAAKGDG